MADGKIEIDIDINDSGAQSQGKKAGDQIAKGVESGLKDVSKTADAAAKSTERSMQSAADSAKSSFSDVGSAAKSGFGDVGDAAKTAASDASSAFENVPADASGAFADVGSEAQSGFDGVSDAAQTAADDAVSAFDGVGNEIAGELDDVDDKAGGVFGTNIPASTAIAGAAVAVLGAKILEIGQNAITTGMDFDESMAQVAATMGVTVDEVDNLRQFAQKMGETTAFSASQSADALNYMALAGYDAETSMRVLPTVLNLAAAGSMDLARASDMVTDAQSALGLSVDEAEVMVDQMAKTSSKTNTSVEQLGDAFLTVGGTAKTLKGGTAELAQMLGLLADNGVKGSEGGTALRNVILSLSAPTDKAAKAIESLGIQVFDAEGNMRAMPDIFNDMNDAMGNLTQEEKTNVLNDIFNKVDLKSVNALLGTSAERFDEVASAIDDAQGSAEAMANTQLDNLAGDVTLLESATEGFFIAVSDKLAPSLRDLAQFGTNTLMPFLTDAVKNFDKIAPYIIAAGVAIGLVVGKNAAVKLMARAFGDLTITVKGSTIAFRDMTVAQKASAVATKGLNTAMKALKTAAPIIILTALIEAATFLADKWQQAKEHTERFAKATTGLESAVTNTALSVNREADSVDDLGAAINSVDMDEFLDKHAQLADSIRDTNLEASTSQAMLTDYADSIRNLAGQTDLTESQVAELKNAVTQVNDQLGTSYTVTQDATGAYQIMADGVDDAKQSILDMIDAQITQIRVQADLKNYEALYSQWQEDLQKTADASAILKDAQQKLAKAEQDSMNATNPADRAKASADMATYGQQVKDAQKNLDELSETTGFVESNMNKANERINLNTLALEDNASAQIKAADANEEFKSGVQATGAKLDDFVIALRDMGYTSQDIASMSQDDAITLASAWRNGYDDFKQATDETIGYVPDALANMGEDAYNEAYGAGQKADEGVADGMADNASTVEGQAKSEARSVKEWLGAEDMTFVGSNYDSQLARGIDGNSDAATTEADKVGDQAADAYGGHEGEAETSGTNLTMGFARGIGAQSAIGWVVSAASNVAAKALQAIKDRGEEGSPWRTTYRSGQFAAQGLANGIKSKKENVKKSASEMADAVVSAATKRINNLKGVYSISLDYELGYWRKIRDTVKKGSDGWYTAQKNVIDIKKKQVQADKAAQDAIISNAKTYIERYKLQNNLSLKSEWSYWQKKIKQVKKGSDAYFEALSMVKNAEQAYYDSVINNASSYVSRQKRLYGMSYKQEADYWKKILAKVKKGSTQYQEAYDNYLEAKINATAETKEKNAELLTAEQNFVDRLREIQQKLTDDIQAARDAYAAAVEDRRQSILSDFNLFDRYRKKVTISGDKLIENIRSQVAATKDYETAMKALEKRIGKGALYEEIADMGMDGLRYVESLNQMTESQLKEFVKLYEERNKVATREATRENKDLLNETNKTIKDLNSQAAKDIKDAAKELKGTAAELGTSLASTVAKMASNVKASANSINSSINSAINSLKRLDSRVSTVSTSTRAYTATPVRVADIPITGYNGREAIFGANGKVEGFSLMATDLQGATYQTEASILRGMEQLTMAVTNSRGIGGDTVNNQTLVFNGGVNSPDEIARTMRMQEFYGLAGKYV